MSKDLNDKDLDDLNDLNDLNDMVFTDSEEPEDNETGNDGQAQLEEAAETDGCAYEAAAPAEADGADESESADDTITNPASTAAYNTTGGASAQPGSAREPEQGAIGPNNYTFYRPNYNNNTAGPAGAAAAAYYPQPPKKKKKWKIIAIIAVIIAAILLISACAASLITGDSGMDADYGGGSSYIGILHVEGTITTSSSSSDTYQQSWLLRQINYMMDDPSNEGLMIYVNSPGGSVYASDELYLKLEEYKEETDRPVYAYFAETAASGGYYIAAGADKITANRNCTTGSIGVYLGPIINASGLLEKVGVQAEIIKSGENKAMGNNYEPLTDEQRAIYQEYVNESYDQFVNIVAKGRNMDVATVKKIADGRVYTAKQAKENGLIDEISSFEDAKDAMLEENKLDDCTFQNVTYTPKNDIYSLLSQKADAKTDSASAEIGMAQDILNGDYTPELMYMMQ